MASKFEATAGKLIGPLLAALLPSPPTRQPA